MHPLRPGPAPWERPADGQGAPCHSCLVGGDEDEDLGLLLARAAVMDCAAAERRDIVAEVHRRTDRPAFEAALALARSDHGAERVLGLDVLGQIGYAQNRPWAGETRPILIAACDDSRAEVLCAAITALGHVADPQGLAAVLRHAAHPGDEVRFAVAATLPALAGDPPADAAVAALARLSADPDPEIRDWATFGLGSQIEADSTPLRQALAARLGDPDGDTAGEALLGLARRRDPIALPILLSLLEGSPGNLIVEAAAALGSPAALPALHRLKTAGWQHDDPRPSVLDEAISACSR
jgi:HEAT repeats